MWWSTSKYRYILDLIGSLRLVQRVLFLFAPYRPVTIRHRGVVQVKILAHLRDKLHLLVDAIEGQRSHGEPIQCLVRNVLISFLVNLWPSTFMSGRKFSTTRISPRGLGISTAFASVNIPKKVRMKRDRITVCVQNLRCFFIESPRKA